MIQSTKQLNAGKLGSIALTGTLARLNPHLLDDSPARQPSAVEREADLHDMIFSECRRRGWIPLHGSMAHRTHRTAGEPDFVILADGGLVLLVECKARNGKLSPTQFAMAHHAKSLGHTIHVVRSFDEFLNLLPIQTKPKTNKTKNK